MQLLETVLDLWVSTHYDRLLMTRVRAVCHHKRRVNKVNSEGPLRTHSHLQYNRIADGPPLTSHSHPAREIVIHEKTKVETLPMHTNYLHPDR